MKSVTFRTNEKILEQARLKAKKQKSSLNCVFNDWLRVYVEAEPKDFDVDSFLKRFEYVKIKRKITREEANER